MEQLPKGESPCSSALGSCSQRSKRAAPHLGRLLISQTGMLFVWKMGSGG